MAQRPTNEGSEAREERITAAQAAGPQASSPSAVLGAGKSAAPDDNELELRDRMLGEFRILRRLGRGGMAEVYLAEQTSLSRNVAIKVLRKEYLTDEAYLKRFKTEAM